MGTLTEAAGTSTDERLTRLFARFIAAGYLFDLAATFPTVLDAGRAAPLLTAVTATAVFGSGAALLPASFARDYRRSINAAAGFAAVAFLGSSVLWLVIDAIAPIRLSGDHFLYFIPALAAMAMAMPAGPAATVVYGIAAPVAVAVLNVRVGPRPDPLLPTALFGVAFTAVFVSASMVAWRAGRRLDDAYAEALAATVAAASAQARGYEDQRFAAMVHDDVIATLLAATRIDAPAAVASHARAVLGSLDAYDDRANRVESSPDEAAATLASTANRIAPGARWAAAVADEASPIPAEVLVAVVTATGEALRNAIRHAGASARITASAEFHDGGLSVEVGDDGSGFDPAAVPPDRLGVAGSIVGQMRAVPGGRAEVVSNPGTGTRVTVRWRR